MVTFLRSVVRLSNYLSETEEKLQTENNTQELLATNVSGLKICVDALTSDFIPTQVIYRN